jgi:hypothetical protein
MKNLILFFAISAILTFSGCGNLSPRNDLENKINNQNGKIGEIENLQNSIKAEMGNIKNQTEVNAKNLKNMQQGLINYNRDNSGIQILQGDGALILIFGIATVFGILWFSARDRAIKSEKATDVLAEALVQEDNIELENQVFSAAMHSGVEEQVLKAMTKHQKIYGIFRN